MKYLVNENNTCGQASLTDDLRNMVLEGMGYTVKKEEVSEQINESVAPQAEVEENYDMPTLYEWDGSVFALDDEVFEIEGDLFLKAIELDSETRMSLDESHADLFINEVKFEETDFSLGDIYDYGDEIFIKLDEAYAMKEGDKKGDKSKDKPEDKPDYTTDARKGDKSKTHDGEDYEDEDDKKKVVKEEESSADKLNRQVGNLDTSTPRGRERATELKRREQARKLDKKNPITKPSQTVASEKDARAAAAAHGDK
jgi:hypothetical protein